MPDEKKEERNVFLCHKCDGALSGPNGVGLYGCGCISGWVRDFYEPYTVAQALEVQAKAKARRQAQG